MLLNRLAVQSARYGADVLASILFFFAKRNKEKKKGNKKKKKLIKEMSCKVDLTSAVKF